MISSSPAIRTGFSQLNNALGGGLKPGITLISGLHHSYRSNLLKTLSMQTKALNASEIDHSEGKPTLIYIQDTMNDDSCFRHSYLSCLRGDVNKMTVMLDAINGVSVERSRMGFNYIDYQVDYKTTALDDLILSVVWAKERDGKDVRLLFIDDFHILNSHKTPGREAQVLKSLRDYFVDKGIACVACYDLCNSAKSILRGLLDERDLVNGVISGNDPEIMMSVDNQIFVHVVNEGTQKKLAVRVRRNPKWYPVTDQDHSSFMLDFPSTGGPIMPDIFN